VIEVFVMSGDGSYLMLPGEPATAVAERITLLVVLVQNNGYASIGALRAGLDEARANDESVCAARGDYERARQAQRAYLEAP